MFEFSLRLSTLIFAHAEIIVCVHVNINLEIWWQVFVSELFNFCSDLELKPVGTLDVKLIQAKELTNKDIIGKSDPFAKLFIRPLRNSMKTSKTIVRMFKL